MGTKDGVARKPPVSGLHSVDFVMKGLGHCERTNQVPLRWEIVRSCATIREPRGQTDLEFLVEKILNRSGPNVLKYSRQVSD